VASMSEKPSTPAALAALEMQDAVRDFLARSVTEGHITHAYLFCGAPGCGMEEAATALAECLVCPNGGDGACDECIRVRHRTHPDVHWLSPGSSQGYLVSEIRNLIADVQLAPVRAKTKLYILESAALLKGAAANALLKTLEEPPEHTVFILLARSSEAVLSTIVSRCQIVPFRAIPEKAAVARVVQKTGVSAQDARIALSVAGTPDAASAYLGEPSKRELRARTIQCLDGLAEDDMWDVLVAARGLSELVREPLKDVKKDQKKERDRVSDYLSAPAIHSLEDAQKRELSARERSGMMEVFAVTESVLRDALLIADGCAEDAVNADIPGLQERIADAGIPAIMAGFAAVGEARQSLAHNVSSQLTLEVMLCAIKEALT
jgi:DNA polymerase-3 subunit delta'